MNCSRTQEYNHCDNDDKHDHEAKVGFESKGFQEVPVVIGEVSEETLSKFRWHDKQWKERGADFTGNQIFQYQTKDKHIYLIPKEKHSSTLIWMHGYTDNASNWIALFNNPQYTPVTLETKVVLLTAKERNVDGVMITSWFEGVSKNYDESYKFVNGVLNDEIKLLGDSRRVFIGGFSQGCAMSLIVGLKFHQQLGGIIGVSGRLFPIQENEQSSKTPVLISHGTADPMIQWESVEESYKDFKKIHAAEVEIILFEGVEHCLCMDQKIHTFQIMINKFIQKVKSQVIEYIYLHFNL